MRSFSKSAIFALSALTFAGVAAAQTSDQSTAAGASPAQPASIPETGASAAPTPVANDDNIVICHYSKQTGTLFMTRICHTKREWARQSQDAHDLMDRMDNGIMPVPGG